MASHEVQTQKLVSEDVKIEFVEHQPRMEVLYKFDFEFISLQFLSLGKWESR